MKSLFYKIFIVIICMPFLYTGCHFKAQTEFNSYSFKYFLNEDDDIYHRQYVGDSSFVEYRILNDTVIDTRLYRVKKDGWYLVENGVEQAYFTDSIFDSYGSKNQNKNFYHRPLRKEVINGSKYYVSQYVDNLSLIMGCTDTTYAYFHIDSGFVKQFWNGSLPEEVKRIIPLNRKVNIDSLPRLIRLAGVY